MKGFSMFKWSKDQVQDLTIRCLVCRACINILRRDGELIVGHVDTVHVHGPI